MKNDRALFSRHPVSNKESRTSLQSGIYLAYLTNTFFYYFIKDIFFTEDELAVSSL